jgi:hypothetical protein
MELDDDNEARDDNERYYLLTDDDIITIDRTTAICPVCLQEFTYNKYIWSVNKGSHHHRVIVCSDECFKADFNVNWGSFDNEALSQ